MRDYKVEISRFDTLSEVRDMVRLGQKAADENDFELWPNWRRLVFVLDGVREISEKEEIRMIVWDILDGGQEIHIKEKGEELLYETEV